MVINHSKTLKSSLIKKLHKLKADVFKLPVTLNKCINLGHRRFLNINIDCPMLMNNFANFGMAKVIGRMKARTCLELLKKELSAFELSLKEDIVFSIIVSASVMIST